MTFAINDSHETTIAKSDTIKAFGATVVAHIIALRAERKKAKSLHSHHTAAHAKLAQAQREVNRVWQGTSIY